MDQPPNSPTAHQGEGPQLGLDSIFLPPNIPEPYPHIPHPIPLTYPHPLNA